jgi:DNA repair exonuclease SbcCD ATPase subunit
MKAKRLIIKNIGIIAETTIEINKPLICFYGDIRQGKSTILNAVRLVFGGAFPDDIIRHGENEASITLECEAATSITREFYRSPNDGLVKARDIVYKISGIPQARPVEKLREFLNPFLLDQNHFFNMSPPARQRFFCELLGVDTGELDAEASDLKDQMQSLEHRIAGYGQIDLTPVEPVDVVSLRKAKTAKLTDHRAQVTKWQTELQVLRDEYEGGKWKELKQAQQHHADLLDKNTALHKQIAELETQLENARINYEASSKHLADQNALVTKLTAEVQSLPDLKPQAEALKAKIAAPCDTSDLDAQIEKGAAQQVRYEAFLERQNLATQRDQANTLLIADKDRLKEIKQLKAKKLAEIAESSGIPKLSFDDEGNFIYDGTTAGMLSTSQLMELSERLSDLYPEGLGLSLLDRGESLGKSIFEYVTKAQAENKTILATIVGEKPATVPANVGVFVVENGQVK